MAELQFPDIIGRFQQGLQFGQQQADRRNQSRLSELASAAYSAPDAESREINIGEAIGVSPQAGFALQENLQGIQDRKQKALIQSASFLGRLPPEQQQSAYAGLRGRLSQEFPDLQLPEAWEQAAPTVAAINQAYGASPGENKVVGSYLLDPSGQVLFEAPREYQTDAGLVRTTRQGAEEIRLGGVPQAGPFTTQEAGGRPVSIGADVDPATRAAILADPNAFASLPDQGEVQLPTQGAPGGRILPRGAGADAERLQLARDANARAAEAARRADEVARRQAEEADIRRRLGATPPGFRVNAAGTAFEPSPGGPKPAGATATEGERKAAVLLKRLEGSLGQLQTAVGQDPGAASPNIAAEAVRRIPFVGGDTSANVFTGQGRQRVEAAQLDILDAALTLGTGAAYTREQLEGYRRSFFPQIGDSPKTIADKQARLDNVIDAARIAAGRAGPVQGSREITSQAEYDALPSGAIYTEDGQQYRKP